MDKNKFFGKIKNFRHKEIVIIVLIIIAILFLLVGVKREDNKNDEYSISQLETAEEILLYQLKEAIGAMSGDEDCKIVIVWEEIEEGNKNSFSNIFSSNNSDVCKKVYGVAVVCENGNDAKLKVNLMNMLSSTLGVAIENISINGKM